MVGVNLYIHRVGTVAIFATLFVAIYVNGVRGCVFDFGLSSDFDLQCNDKKGTWTVNEDIKDSPDKKVLILAPEQDGCLKTKDAVVLNSTVTVTFRFYRDTPKDEAGKVTLRLIPKEGNCPDEECFWDVSNDSQYKSGEWITAEYKFPLKSMKEYFVQLQVDKSKGKFLLDRISVPSAVSDSRCHLEAIGNAVSLPNQLTGVGKNASGGAAGGGGSGGGGSSGGGSSGGGSGGRNNAPGLAEISKNLMLTSASVLTLNNLLN